MSQNMAQGNPETGPIAPGPGGSSPLEGKLGAEMEVWVKWPDGRFGLYTFVLDLEQRTQAPIFQVATTRFAIEKKIRKTYVALGELAKLQGKILKQVRDVVSFSARHIYIHYYYISAQGLVELPAQKGFRDQNGFFDIVQLPDGKQLKVRKDAFEVISA